MSIIRGSLITGTSKAQTSRNIMRLMKLSTQQKNSTKKRAIGDKQDKEAARTKEVSRREKESKQRQGQAVKGVSEETDTEKRQKVVAVSRPETAKTPLDARSKLYKQTEIKNKIIDENEVKSMTFQKYHNLPDSLVSAVTSVLEKAKNPFIDDDKKMKSKKDDDQDDDDDTDMKSKKNDDLDDKDEDDSDKMIGTSGKKTKVELKPKTQSANEETGGLQSLGRSTSSYDAKHKPEDKRRSELYKHPDGHIEVHNFNNHYGYGKPISITKHNDYASATRAATDHLRTAGAKPMKEETELDEAMKWDKKSHASLPAMDQPSLKAHKEAANWHRENYEDSSGDAKQYHKKRMLHHTTQADAMKEEVEAEHIAEDKTHTVWFQKGTKIGARSARGVGVTANSDKHAIELAKKQFSDHKDGWSVSKIKSHAKEEVTLSDEETLRILNKLEESDDKAYKYRDTDPADKDNDYDATKDKNPEHIVMQLRKAKSLGAANRPIHFHDGSKVKVSSAHVQKALDMHGSFKRAPAKDEFTQKLQASHSSFKKALGE